jgi:hypothetical protein
MQLVDQGKISLDMPIEADLEMPLPSYGPDPFSPGKYAPYSRGGAYGETSRFWDNGPP